MKYSLLLLLLFTCQLLAQTEAWDKIIPQAKISVKYYGPGAAKQFNVLKNSKSELNQSGNIQSYSDDKLTVVLTFKTYAQFIEVSGNVLSAGDSDLCYTLKLSFPIQGDKKIFWNLSADSSIAVSGDEELGNYTDASTVVPPAGSFNASQNSNGGYGDAVGTGKMSFYPLASVSLPNTGLGWGIDLGLPVVYRLSYQPKEGICAEFDLASAGETVKFPHAAFFRLQLFEHDPAWHFRAALAKYYAINPEFFKKRVAREGIWLPFSPLHAIKGFKDFGFAFHEMDSHSKDPGLNNAPTIEADRQADVYSFQYTEPWDVQIPIKNFNLPYSSVTGDEVIPGRFSESIKNTAALDKNNLWEARKLDTPWFESGCAVSITTNADPDISGANRYNYVRDDEINPAIRQNVDGIYFDSMEWNWHFDLNYNRRHFAFMDYPLTFSGSLENPKPAIWNYASEYKMMSRIAAEMHLKKKLVMGNGFGWMPFAPGVLDLFGAEFSLYLKGDSDKKKLEFNRAIAGQKPIVFLLNEGLNDSTFTKAPYTGYRQYFEKMLLYGFFPSFFSENSSNNPYWQDSVKYNAGRPSFIKYIPLIKTVAAAGWEPVTYATANQTDILLERFGNDVQHGLYYTVYNDGKTAKQITISIDAASLNQQNIANAKELISGRTYQIEKKSGKYLVTFSLDGGRASLLELH